MSFLYSNKRKEEFFWTEDNYICTCIITTNFGSFTGVATCHPDDEDMNSRLTGEQLSYHRALVKMLKHERDNIILPSIKALKHTLSIAEMGKEDESWTHTALTLRRQIKNWEFELSLVRDAIAGEIEWLYNYITEKEKFYQKIRAKRNKKQ